MHKGEAMAGNMLGMVEKRPIRLRPAVWGTAAFLLLPLVAMRFTREVVWDATDFATMGTMLVVACSLYEVATRITDRCAYRTISGLAIAACFLIIWADLAVGIFH